jgi:hypothetical protein
MGAMISMEPYMFERLEKLLNQLLDTMQEDTHAERTSDSLATIAKQLTIQNQLAMLRMIREIPSGQQTDRYFLRTTLDAIEKGVPYLHMFKQEE